ncbi:MAG: hypothetical protein AB1Z98_13745 [Nannocystaceae bacterium]
MKHALLVGVPERGATGGLEPVAGVDAVATLLEDIGGWSTTILTGQEATRSRVLAALDTMVSACGVEDACLFYFFGHGGVVRFSELAGDLGRRAVFYLATLRPAGSLRRVGVLDIEISAALARLDRICRNVTAIVDCCHAASMVRDGPIPTVSPPPWVRELADAGEDRVDGDLLLAAQGHPRILRLFGSSSLRSAYATQRPQGRYGLMTQGFVDIVREAGLRCDRLTWDAVARRVREWASGQRGTEEQRVVLAGPGHRRLFDRRTVPLPRSATFIPGSSRGRGWIRAGLLQGMRVGDRWGIAELELGKELEPRFLADARVLRVELDSSEVVLSDPSVCPPAGASAMIRELDQPSSVVVEDLPVVDRALRRSALVQPIDEGAPDPVGWVRRAAGYREVDPLVDVLDDAGRPIWLDASIDPHGLERLVELLEDRARARRFERALTAASVSASADTDLVWEWGTVESDHELRPGLLPDGDRAPRIHVGDRLWLRLGHRGSTPRQWFVSVLQIGLEGRLGLLNVNEPEGIEVVRGVSTYVGVRGHRRRQGLTCCWPDRVPKDGPRPDRLLILASRRPLSLSHLVRLPEPDDPTAFAAQGLGLGSTTPVRGQAHPPFEVSRGWTWGQICFEVDPRPRRGRPFSTQRPPRG